MDLAGGDAVRAHYGAPSELVRRKVLPALDRHAIAFIARSPFMVIASADAEGHCDATPRGDAPGFVRVLDAGTLLIPDRRGNNRVDTMLNVAANPRVGLLFMIPGIGETLRVNGGAAITTDAAVLAPLAVQGRAPSAGLVVRVREAFFHCAKAMIRSALWEPQSRQERGDLPSLGRIVADQIEGVDAAAAEAGIAEGYRTRLY